MPDSDLFPEYTATELILSQKDDSKVASQQRKSRHPERGLRQRTQVPSVWQAVGGSVYMQSAIMKKTAGLGTSCLTNQAKQRGSEADPWLGHSSAEKPCPCTLLIIWSYVLLCH